MGLQRDFLLGRYDGYPPFPALLILDFEGGKSSPGAGARFRRLGDLLGKYDFETHDGRTGQTSIVSIMTSEIKMAGFFRDHLCSGVSSKLFSSSSGVTFMGIFVKIKSLAGLSHPFGRGRYSKRRPTHIAFFFPSP